MNPRDLPGETALVNARRKKSSLTDKLEEKTGGMVQFLTNRVTIPEVIVSQCSKGTFFALRDLELRPEVRLTLWHRAPPVGMDAASDLAMLSCPTAEPDLAAGGPVARSLAGCPFMGPTSPHRGR